MRQQQAAAAAALPGLPAAQVFALVTTNFSQAVMLTLPFTVAVFMVRGFLAAEQGVAAVSEEQVGRVTGMLAAVYSFSQFFLSYAWGLASNRFGRKFVLVMGTCVSAVCLVWFGLAGSIATAAASRIVAGLLNGILVAWKCMIGETCQPARQAILMTYMGLAWGLGCVVGPGIGGLMSQPCVAWPAAPGCAPRGILAARPYLLPCAVAAAVSVFSLLLNVFVVEETLPAIVAARRSRQQQQQQQQQQGACCSGGSVPSSWHRLCQRLSGAGEQSHARTLAASGGSLARYQRLLSSSSRRSSSSISRGGAADGDLLVRIESGLDDDAEKRQLLELWGATASDVAPQQQQQQDQAGRAHATPAGWWRGLRRSLLRQLSRGDSAWAPDQLQSTKAAGSETGAAGQASKGEALELAASSSFRIAAVHAGASSREQETTHDCFAPRQQALSSGSNSLCSSRDSSSGGSSSPGREQQQQQDHHQQQQHYTDAETGRSAGGGADQARAAAETDALLPPAGAAPAATAAGAAPAATAAGAAPAAAAPWYRDRQVMLALAGYGMCALLFCALDEITPIYASAPLQEGGLSLQEVQLAGPLAFGGLCLISISLFVYPRLQRLWGTLPLTRRGLLLAVGVSLAIPCARFAAVTPAAAGAAAAGAAATPARAGTAAAAAAAEGGSGIGPWAWAVLYAAMLFKSAAGCAAFTGAMVMVNALASPEQLGAVNGVGQSLAALARGIGPAMGGVLWGAAVHIARPGAQLLPYAAVACCALACWLIFVHVRPLDGEEAVGAGDGGSKGGGGSGGTRYERLD